LKNWKRIKSLVQTCFVVHFRHLFWILTDVPTAVRTTLLGSATFLVIGTVLDTRGESRGSWASSVFHCSHAVKATSIGAALLGGGAIPIATAEYGTRTLALCGRARSRVSCRVHCIEEHTQCDTAQDHFLHSCHLTVSRDCC